MNSSTRSVDMLVLKSIQERIAKIEPSTRQEILAASADIDGVVRYASEQTQDTLRALRRSASVFVEKSCSSRLSK